jgi:hypothetical protein
MMGEMMKDRQNHIAMMQMMQQGGMMSKECMQSCMKMMDSKEKGYAGWQLIKLGILCTNLKSEKIFFFELYQLYAIVRRFSI